MKMLFIFGESVGLLFWFHPYYPISATTISMTPQKHDTPLANK